MLIFYSPDPKACDPPHPSNTNLFQVQPGEINKNPVKYFLFYKHIYNVQRNQPNAPYISPVHSDKSPLHIWAGCRGGSLKLRPDSHILDAIVLIFISKQFVFYFARPEPPLWRRGLSEKAPKQPLCPMIDQFRNASPEV